MKAQTICNRLAKNSFFGRVLLIVASAGIAAPAWAKEPVGGKPKPIRYQTGAAPEGGVPAELTNRNPADIKGPKPIIKPENDVHDFGTVWTGPQLKYTFKIKNAGDAALDISSVKPSCGCTIAGDYPKKLEPGESGDFPFAMQSNKLHGNFAKHVTVTSNDPITPNLRLTLRGEVKQYVEVTPSTVTFGRITDQEPKTRELTIVNNTEKPLQLEVKKGTNPAFEYRLDQIEEGKRYALHVTAKPPFAEGTMNDAIVISTNIDEQKEISVRTIASVPPRLEVQPNSILINDRGEAGSGQPIARVLRFTNYGKSKAKLIEATVDDPLVAVAVRERKEGEAYTVEVQLPAGYQPPPEGRHITLKIEDAETPEIKVPIRGMPKPELAQVAPRPKPEDMVGKPAPAFAIETIDGKALSSDTLKDNVTVLNFFAPNCGFCKKQIPRLEPIRQQFDGKGVRFVNVSQRMGKEFSKEEVVEIMKGLGFKGELAINHENTVGEMFASSGFPTMVVIGKDGKVGAVNVGNVGDLESRLTGQLEALVAGKPVPATPEVQLAQNAPAPAKAVAAETAKAAPQPTPAPKPAQARVNADDMVGKAAPAFSLKTVDGKDLSSDTVKTSAATVLNFFAGNCGFCKKQIPRLETLRKEFEGKNVRFVNVAETMRQEYSQDEIMNIMKETGWTGEVARDPKNEVGPPFGANGFPTMVIVDKEGRVAAVNVGNIADLETRVRAQVQALVDGKPVPAALAKAPPKPARPSPNDMLGKPAPAFALKTIDGKDLSNDTLKDSAATVLNFYAPNCGFCKKQIPRLETIRKDYQGKGVRFVNVTETMGKEFSQEEAMNVLKDLNWGDEVARDPSNEVGRKFSVSGFPTMVVIGKNGKVQAVNVGNVADLETKMKEQLDALIAGKDIAQAAPAAPAPSQADAAPKRRPAEELVGQPAPEFTLTTMAGKPVASADFGKHPATVLNFVAPNCGFCKRQVPNVDKVRNDYESKGVRFVNVAQKMGNKEFSNDEIHQIFKDAGSNLEMAKDDDNQVGQKYKAQSYPTMFVVGKDGKVAQVIVGAKPDLEASLRTKLDEMLK